MQLTDLQAHVISKLSRIKTTWLQCPLVCEHSHVFRSHSVRNTENEHYDQESGCSHRSLGRVCCGSLRCGAYNQLFRIHVDWRCCWVVGCGLHGIVWGVVTSGSICAILQSIGAAGLGAAGAGVASVVEGGVGAGVGVLEMR